MFKRGRITLILSGGNSLFLVNGHWSPASLLQHRYQVASYLGLKAKMFLEGFRRRWFEFMLTALSVVG